jgi:hypothetical protein
MATPSTFSPGRPTDDEPQVTIEMGGPNVVIRSVDTIDREYTTSLAHALNAAAEADTVVVIDPPPIRCDDVFAALELPLADTACPIHDDCLPTDVEVVSSGVLRIEGEHIWWTIDLHAGRLCRTDSAVDVRFLGPQAWMPVIAVCVTPTKVSAFTIDETVVTGLRAHRSDSVLLAS